MNNHNQDISQTKNVSQSPTVILNTWATQHHISTEYVLLNEQLFSSSPNSSQNYPRISFYYRLYLGNELYFDGHDSSHQQARNNCAYHALNFINQNQLSTMISPPSTPSQVTFFSKMRIVS